MARAYTEYDWKTLVESNELKKLYVAELDKYLKHNKLDGYLKISKNEKVKVIRNHLGYTEFREETSGETARETSEESEGQSEWEELEEENDDTYE